MLKPQLHCMPCVAPPPSLLLRRGRSPALPGQYRAAAAAADRSKKSSKRSVRCTLKELPPSSKVKAADDDAIVTVVKATATVKVTVGGLLSNLGLSRGINDIVDLLGRSLLLELVSTQLDPKSGEEKETLKAYAHKGSQEGDEIKYEATFEVPKDFGNIGGVFVTNEHNKELFLDEIKLIKSSVHNDPASSTLITITCKSWVQSKWIIPADEKRLFFTNNSNYLPAQTPDGLRRLRKKELEIVRGNGRGERKAFERIYDYDVYNDLGDPDSGEDKIRPVLGGSKQFPYPRRCRTGRPRSTKDPKSETRSSGGIYVPRDEAFSEVKSANFSTTTLRSVLPAVAPSIGSAIIDTKLGFPNFTAVDKLFSDGLTLPKLQGVGFLKGLFLRLIKTITDGPEEILLFETPEMIENIYLSANLYIICVLTTFVFYCVITYYLLCLIAGDRFSWMRDEEFARQTLAGVNPYAIQLLKEFPVVSKLDPEVYGPPESAITAEMLEEEMKGVMTVQEVIQSKRLFILDYHDLLLPYVHKVRELENTTLYGSRTIFFLTNDGTLRPLAIELTRPPSATEPQWKQVFRPSRNSTGYWLWMHAKSHVRAHDSCHHELISHWLRTHCCVEPYCIAAHRQLSEMHPIYRLLHPHFRYTMAINAIARQNLINAGGIIQLSFSPLKYSMEISSVAYDQLWRFDMEALPADLIRRGMAVEDSTAEHGLRLTIDDYPFANDGLLIWSAIEHWVGEYVSHYYPSPSDVTDDAELQGWWDEVRSKGHGDKKDEPWWPELNTAESLTRTLATVIWVASAHHAAVNFGQYPFGGYFPNRPSTARTNMPTEDASREGFATFLRKPEVSLLHSLPSQIQATLVMAVLNVLSNHSVDEEYLGGEAEAAWAEDPVIRAAFERFNERLREIEGIIDERNADTNRKNRFGAGVVPYELMKPFSKRGVTGKGIPNSVSI